MYDQRARSFTGITAFKKDYAVITAVDDELADQNVDHSIVFRYANDTWGKKTLEGATRGSIVLEEGARIFNMGVDGRIFILNLPGVSEEHVDTSDDGPSNLLALRVARRIGDEVYVAGMGRHVYKRAQEGVWLQVDSGVFLEKESRTHAIGFNAIDGFSAGDIYCAGYAGEIWHFDGNGWIQKQSPSNVVLNCILCAGDGLVYACGMAGTIIRGRGDAWEAITQDVTTSDFWGMTSFNGKLYLSSYEGLFKVTGDLVEQVDPGIEVSTAYLDAADGRIWSVGLQDIAYSDDAVNWVQVANP
ncbi:hypothetical protein [Marilutibacter alkalisoli]|uniref:Photosynthesis system II assembly factor Ycf48/Hcf136-like domain-containing protein n=1 Tax=Marilutibacter alkalisoli TaxID=2591633 RepID=A0A514BVS2_9GAMM|nr:hypothetical protein [Lysobacter alkalisoli]QDH71467.1 hypothetical protein FKV23_16240 [Lysobacter alkalisoli]